MISEITARHSTACSCEDKHLKILRMFLEAREPEDVRERDNRASQLASAHMNAKCLSLSSLVELFEKFGHDAHRYDNRKRILGFGLQYRLASWKSMEDRWKWDEYIEIERWMRVAMVASFLKLGPDIDSSAFSVCERPRELYFDTRPWHSPLQFAAALDNTDLVQMLVDRGANVYSAPAPFNGATALQFAAINGNFKILDLLVSAGADINAKRATYQGRTALEGAAESGRLDMMVYLLEGGANIEGKRNGVYKRAICRAWKHGHCALARIIQTWKSERFGEQD